ncbi:MULTISPECIES: DUF4269 domain-containing protein [Thalassospira]|uniref:DUF4269 domain-containing protein n=1 Tax=Thalassospira aquimaris TaxID=3037796 RepID=A0ABT6GEK8_9PROT|nr:MULTISPECIES: DUF4269 domain-containing protein [Thalassospira]MDG4720515.1 DUF4269 domain-containing protein [Thalassospira sp. FZY0004]
MNQTVMDWSHGLSAADFRGLDRLGKASARGLAAAGIVRKYRILDLLADFDPVIAGTLPIAIDTATSDIDILCHVTDLETFREFCQGQFGTFDQFSCHERSATANVGAAVVVNFVCDDLPIEIFATNHPSTAQYGFIHMLVEARILALMGGGFADEVRALKESGIKTEPAFARLLEISGDPYIALAEMIDLSPDQLAAKLHVTRD